MAKFCTSCGAPVGDGLKFCAQCGKAVTATADSAGAVSAARPSRVIASAAPVAAKASNPTKTIIITLLAFFAVIAVVAAAGFVYVGYRVHKKVEEVKQGFSMGQLGAGNSRNASASKGERGECSLITQQEMGAVLGTPISKVVQRPGQCEYTPQGAYDGLTIKPEWTGGRVGMGFLTGLGQKLEQHQLRLGNLTPSMDAVPGLGDEAYIQFGMLYVRKNDVMVTIDTNSVISRDQEIAIARAIVPRM